MSSSSAAALAERAPAKINLTLRIGKRRADGYHELESLVAFADLADRVSLRPGSALALSIEGPTSAEAGRVADNLILKAARALHGESAALALGAFHLEKVLPVAAGIGGGSSDAAAALRLIAKINKLSLNDARLYAAARATGADVPVCLDPRPKIMRGIGEVLSKPLFLPALPVLLVNPRVAVPTGPVFAQLAALRGNNAPAFLTADAATELAEKAVTPELMPSAETLLRVVAASHNHLEEPAIVLQPVIADVLKALRALPGCKLARMSGSGATCFGIFNDGGAATEAERLLRAKHPQWWIHASVLNAR